MKQLLTISCLVLAAAAQGAEGDQPVSTEILSVGLTPQQKKSIKLTPDLDENPFANVEQVEEPETFEDVSLQEQKIRSVFSSLGVSGVTNSRGGFKVLVGDMILREGGFVPAVIPDQTERLQVTSISEEEVVISWVEEEDESPRRRGRSNKDTGRQLVIPISRGAKISPQLPRVVSRPGVGR